ncbi:exosome complex component RRP40-like [Schistocerca americana]|uniref:exosome complex component RRP40-like n=1 Tax=Schistocerca americana TaxID=7009 RepID=UPI001F4F4E72|nr:exosome complex component RRP40-like [Schistocerca americana]XP_047119009.1 exosome complex component RRP40-like [Schistocerca piceifrons]XP_049776124.1 exosome complex component RRP40 [Schistocerca cancellata]
MDVSVGDVVIPGDNFAGLPSPPGKTQSVIGPGLRLETDKVIVSRCGIIRQKGANTYFVDGYHQKRYIPAKGETVVGTITNKSGDIFKVDIGASEQASLSYLAFEGATKKNRPNVQVGDIVFAKLILPSKDMEPELVCVDSHGKKGKLGPVPEGGFVFSCSLNLIRKILRKNCPLLRILGTSIPHEIAVGMNGRIWVKASTVKETVAVGNAILAAEYTDNDEIKDMCQSIFGKLSRE